jgi:hypothetical protein
MLLPISTPLDPDPTLPATERDLAFRAGGEVHRFSPARATADALGHLGVELELAEVGVEGGVAVFGEG